MEFKEAFEVLDDSWRIEHGDLGEYWNYLCNIYSFKDFMSENLVEQIECEIINEAKRINDEFEVATEVKTKTEEVVELIYKG